MIPRIPSEPITSRSGLGPAPRARQPPRLDQTFRGNDAKRFTQIIDVGVERGEMTARAGRDPAAERRALETLREMTKREPMRLELRLQRRSERAGLDAGGTRGLVDFEHAAKLTQVDASPSPCAAPHRAVAQPRRQRSIRRRTGSRSPAAPPAQSSTAATSSSVRG